MIPQWEDSCLFLRPSWLGCELCHLAFPEPWLPSPAPKPRLGVWCQAGRSRVPLVFWKPD